MTTTAISNSDDVIDSRDVIARVEELESERDDWEEVTPWAEANEEESRELDALQALTEEAEGYCPDWRHGATLIRDSYFKEYAQELADDIGAIDRNASWPCNCIDWEQAASELQMDYTSAEFDGVTYWVR